MSELIDYQFATGVATLTLNNGKVNAISSALVEAFNHALDRAETDRAIVVFTGKNGILSAGYDLKEMTSDAQNAKQLVTAGSTLARRLLAHPYPVIAACNGHAVAKGAFLLLAADYRLGVQGAFSIGLNEVQIGITMHQVGLELARERLSNTAFSRAVINAEMFEPHAAVAAGFLDQAIEPAAFDAELALVIEQFKKLNMTAHRQTKLKARQALLARLDQAIALDQL